MTSIIHDPFFFDLLAENLGGAEEASTLIAAIEAAGRTRKRRVGCVHEVLTGREREDGTSPVTVRVKIKDEPVRESFSNGNFGNLSDGQIAELKRAQDNGVEVELIVEYTDTGKIVHTVAVTKRPCKSSKETEDTSDC